MRRVITAGVACLVAACSAAELPATNVVVRIDGDEGVRSLAELRVEVFAADADDESEPVSSSAFELGKNSLSLPLSFGIARDKADSFLVSVTGYHSASEDAVIEAKAVGSFQPGKIELLRLFLSDDCLDTPCNSLNETCEGGECAGVPVADTTLIVPGHEFDSPPRDEHPDGDKVDAGETMEAKVDNGAGQARDAGNDRASSNAEQAQTGDSSVMQSAPTCETGNPACHSDYPCLDLPSGGYYCRGQFAEWPIPDASQGSKHSLSYDIGSVPGVVIDQVTGLWWTREVPDQIEGCEDYVNVAKAFALTKYYCTQDEARAYCSELVLGSKDDWRLPTIPELVSLIDDSRNPALSPAFTISALDASAQNYMYMSASTVVGSTDLWTMNFSLHAYWGRSPSGAHDRVRCVRGDPQAPPGYTPAQHYVVDEKSVTDTRTQLAWQRDVSTEKLELSAARSRCQSAGSGSRLPTRKELASLIDLSRSLPAIDPLFGNTPSGENDYFWSSTPSLSQSGGLHCYLFGSGTDTVCGETGGRAYVRCVRSL